MFTARGHYLGGLSRVLNKQQTVWRPVGYMEVRRSPQNLTTGAHGPRSATQRRAMEQENVVSGKCPEHREREQPYEPPNNRVTHTQPWGFSDTVRENVISSQGSTRMFLVFLNSTWMHQVYFFILLKSQIQTLLVFLLIKSFTKLPLQLWKSKEK